MLKRKKEILAGVKELNKKYKVGKFSFMANSRAKAIDDAEGFVKIFCETWLKGRNYC